MENTLHVNSRFLSPGISEDADRIAGLMNLRDNASASITLDRPVALQQLAEVVCEWQTEHPKDRGLIDSYLNAIRFIKSLPHNIPDPEIEVDEDSEVSLDWFQGPRRCFSVSISRDGELAFAGLFGHNPIHDKEYFADRIPVRIIEGIRRVYS